LLPPVSYAFVQRSLLFSPPERSFDEYRSPTSPLSRLFLYTLYFQKWVCPTSPVFFSLGLLVPLAHPLPFPSTPVLRDFSLFFSSLLPDQMILLFSRFPFFHSSFLPPLSSPLGGFFGHFFSRKINSSSPCPWPELDRQLSTSSRPPLFPTAARLLPSRFGFSPLPFAPPLFLLFTSSFSRVAPSSHHVSRGLSRRSLPFLRSLSRASPPNIVPTFFAKKYVRHFR